MSLALRGHKPSPQTLEASAIAHTTHGATRGKRWTGAYRSWKAAKQRCFDPNTVNYARYGGLGVIMCEAWRNDFAVFLRDMGERPEGTSLDRVDPNGNYEPGNCRWATALEQRHNRRRFR
jgi:hypothetical protein